MIARFHPATTLESTPACTDKIFRDEIFGARISYVDEEGPVACSGVPARGATRMDEDVNMKACPLCNLADAWRLGDGRYKCQSCNRRYSWRSVWESIRLPEPAKHSLLRAFAGDGAAPPTAISPAQRQRFNQLARACCALRSPIPVDAMYIHECRSPLPARSPMRGWASARHVMILGIAERAGSVHICSPLVSSTDVVGLLRVRSALGGVLRVCDNFAYASLPIVNDYVSIPRATHGVLAMHAVEEFWHYARRRLQEYRRIPVRQLSLYLGELCFRFNHRGEDVAMLLHQLMQSAAMSEVRSLRPNSMVARADALLDGASTARTHT